MLDAKRSVGIVHGEWIVASCVPAYAESSSCIRASRDGAAELYAVEVGVLVVNLIHREPLRLMLHDRRVLSTAMCDVGQIEVVVVQARRLLLRP